MGWASIPATRTCCSEFSNACTGTTSSKAPASVSQLFDALSNDLVVASGPRATLIRARLFSSPFGSRKELSAMTTRSVLLAEDSAFDAELTLKALQPYRLSNKVDVVRDGSEALDYLYCRGPFAERERGNPILILLDLKMPK